MVRVRFPDTSRARINRFASELLYPTRVLHRLLDSLDRRVFRFLVALALGCAGAMSAACSGPQERAVSVYSGAYTDQALVEEILIAKPVSFENATLVSATYGQVFAQPSESYRWEWEAGLATWFGQQNHQELNGLVLFRWLDLPWNHVLRTSLALGNGLSLASRDPRLEEAFHPDTGSTNLLYHIAVEAEFALPRAKHWSGFLRIHHRSGVFGLFNDINGGSNVIGLGLRYWF